MSVMPELQHRVTNRLKIFELRFACCLWRFPWMGCLTFQGMCRLSMTEQRCLRAMTVSSALAGFLYGCGGSVPPTPDIPPRRAAVAQGPPPLPAVPPAERGTRVFPLDSRNCGAADRTYIEDTLVEVRARCVVTENTARVVLTVFSRATDRTDYFQAMSQRFCGDVIDATAPEGWEVAIERHQGLRNLAAEVTWEWTPVAATGQRSGQSSADFTVTLRGKWWTGIGHYVAFMKSGGPFAASPHDCPYSIR